MFRIKCLKRNAKQSRLKHAMSRHLSQQGSTVPETNEFLSTDAFNPAIDNNDKRKISCPSRLDDLSLRENNNKFNNGNAFSS